MKHNQQGLSFIEVLVAVVVIAVGLLGIVGLQGAAVGNTTLSSMRSTAAIEANNLVARMRANTVFWRVAEKTGYEIEMKIDNQIDPPSPAYTNTITDPAQVDPISEIADRNCNDLVCAAEQMARYDIDQWYTGLLDTLHPKASASILYHADGYIRITITWSERKSAFAGAANANKSYVVSVNL